MRDAARTGATRVSAAERRRGSSYITRWPSRRAANIASTTSPCAAAPTTPSPPKRISAGISSPALAIRASTSSGPDTKDRAPYRQEELEGEGPRPAIALARSRQRPGLGDAGGRRIARPNRSISLRNLCRIDRRARLRVGIQGRDLASSRTLGHGHLANHDSVVTFCGSGDVSATVGCLDSCRSWRRA